MDDLCYRVDGQNNIEGYTASLGLRVKTSQKLIHYERNYKSKKTVSRPNCG